MKEKKEILNKYIETTFKKFPCDKYSKGFKDGYLKALYWVVDIEV